MAHGLKLTKYLPAFREIAREHGLNREDLAHRLGIDVGGLEHALEVFFGSPSGCTLPAIAALIAKCTLAVPSCGGDLARWRGRQIKAQTFARYAPIMEAIIELGERQTIAIVERYGSNQDAWRSFKVKWFGAGVVTAERAKAFLKWGEKVAGPVAVSA